VDVAIPELGLALVVGVGLGLWFFGGLLWTVGRLPGARHPAPLMLISFVVRAAGVVVGVMWLAGRHGLLPLAAALVGFIAVRMWMLRAWGNPRPKRSAE
jgi:F1F0 ATPase subunit 2